MNKDVNKITCLAKHFFERLSNFSLKYAFDNNLQRFLGLQCVCINQNHGEYELYYKIDIDSIYVNSLLKNTKNINLVTKQEFNIFKSNEIEYYKDDIHFILYLINNLYDSSLIKSKYISVDKSVIIQLNRIYSRKEK